MIASIATNAINCKIYLIEISNPILPHKESNGLLINKDKPKTNIVGTMITQYINSNSTNLSKDNKSIDQSACNIQYK